MNWVKLFRFWFPVLAYSVIIFAVSSIPRLRVPLDTSNADKVVHLFEYLILGMLTARAVSHSDLGPKHLSLGIVILFCALYGFSDELHQLFVPGRDSDWKDLLADTCGGALGGWLYLKFQHSFACVKKHQPIH